jgi:hypothetical protein
MTIPLMKNRIERKILKSSSCGVIEFTPRKAPRNDSTTAVIGLIKINSLYFSGTCERG